MLALRLLFWLFPVAVRAEAAAGMTFVLHSGHQPWFSPSNHSSMHYSDSATIWGIAQRASHHGFRPATKVAGAMTGDQHRTAKCCEELLPIAATQGTKTKHDSSLCGACGEKL